MKRFWRNSEELPPLLAGRGEEEQSDQNREERGEAAVGELLRPVRMREIQSPVWIDSYRTCLLVLGIAPPIEAIKRGLARSCNCSICIWSCCSRAEVVAAAARSAPPTRCR